MYYTCQQIAEKFNVKRRTVWSWIRSGKLPAIRLGEQYRVSEEDLQRFIARAGPDPDPPAAQQPRAVQPRT